MRIARTLTFFFTVAFAAPAVAADMPLHKAPPAAAMFDWSGHYGGINAGYGFGRLRGAIADGGIEVLRSANANGALAGGQIGANFQAGNIVWGVEADIQKSWMKGSEIWDIPGLVPITATLEIDWFATVRGRAGIANGTSLFYVTGGLAYGERTASLFDGTGTVNDSDTRLGWTVGAGYEGAVAQNWSWKIEYLYLDFSGKTKELGGGLTFETPTSAHIIRLGTNYRFGS